MKVCKIRFALSSPTLGKLFRIEETFCLEIYILRDVYIYLFCVRIIGMRGTMKQILESQFMRMFTVD